MGSAQLDFRPVVPMRASGRTIVGSGNLQGRRFVWLPLFLGVSGQQQMHVLRLKVNVLVPTDLPEDLFPLLQLIHRFPGGCH